MDVDLKEAQEHIEELEHAIEWCVRNRAIVKFTPAAVFVNVKLPGLSTIYSQGPTFLDVIQQIEGSVH